MHLMVNALKLGLIPYLVHSVHSVKRLSSKTEGFVVISRSKLHPYQDDSLQVLVINSSHSRFSSWFTAK